METDFRSMKRKQLQALCKKHGLPANVANSQMADALSALLQEKRTRKGCLKGSGGSDGVTKKVSFTLAEDEEEEEKVRRGVGRKRRLSVGNAGKSEGAVRTRRSLALAKAVVSGLQLLLLEAEELRAGRERADAMYMMVPGLQLLDFLVSTAT